MHDVTLIGEETKRECLRERERVGSMKCVKIFTKWNEIEKRSHKYTQTHTQRQTKRDKRTQGGKHTQWQTQRHTYAQT